MNCKNHTGIESNYYCSFCGQTICHDCMVELNKRFYCKECLNKSIELSNMNYSASSFSKKSRFLTFILGFVPGAGHMYLGLMNKGLTIMSSFFGLIFLIGFFGNLLYMRSSPLDFAIPFLFVFVFYSIFDALGKVGEINKGNVVCDSTPINFESGYHYFKERVLKKKIYIGYALVIIGCLSIINFFSYSLNHLLIRYFQIDFPFSLTDLIVPVALAFTGLYLVGKGKKEEQ